MPSEKELSSKEADLKVQLAFARLKAWKEYVDRAVGKPLENYRDKVEAKKKAEKEKTREK